VQDNVEEKIVFAKNTREELLHQIEKRFGLKLAL
jgi:hypothetical protein